MAKIIAPHIHPVASMNILAFDTSSSACTVALQLGNTVHASHTVAPMQQAKLILPMIQELLAAHHLSLSDLHAIAYGCGPGSFTGIRIANSVAQGLGYATGLPIISVSSLAAIAQAAFLEQNWHNLTVAVDARMGKIYWANYQVAAGTADQRAERGRVALIGEERLTAPEEISLPENEVWYGVGDGWEKYGAMIQHRPQTIKPSQLPTAEALLSLAIAKLERGETMAAADAMPVYLR